MREQAFFIAENMTHQYGLQQVKDRLNTLHGILSVQLDTAHQLFGIDYNSVAASYDEIEHTLNQMGFFIAADASRIQTR